MLFTVKFVDCMEDERFLITRKLTAVWEKMLKELPDLCVAVSDALPQVGFACFI